MGVLDAARNMVERAYRRPKARCVRAQTDAERELLSLVIRRYDASALQRRDLEGQWAVASSYLRGTHWVEWQMGQLVDIRIDPQNPESVRNFQSADLFRTFIIRAAARACARRPDVSILPRSESELDRKAAQELEVMDSHYSQHLKSQDTLRKVVTYALTCTTGYLKQYWDSNLEAEVPVEWDEETKEPTRYAMRPVGDLVEEFIPGYQVYLDPGAASIHQSKWVMQVRRVPTSAIYERYGVRVQSDYARWQLTETVKQQVAYTTMYSHNPPQDDRATVYEMYERPGVVIGDDGEPVEIPNGRTTICTEGQVLDTQDCLPCGMVPFLPLGWLEDPFSPYDTSIGLSLIPLQDFYNGVLSQYRLMLRRQKMVITRSALDGAGADLEDRIKETVDMVTLFHTPGEQPPAFQLPPMPTDVMLASLEKIERLMGDVSGVHDVSQGTPNAEAKSGVAIRMLQDSDQQLMALFHLRVEEFCRQRTLRRAHIVSQYAIEPRVWSVDNQGNAQKPGMNISALEALRNGGAASVFVVPGSATPRLPEMQDEQVLGLAQSGLIDPETALRAMTSPAASKALEIQKQVREEQLQQRATAAMLDEATSGGGGFPAAPPPMQGQGNKAQGQL